MHEIRVGIVGAGLSATTFHAPFIVSHPSFKLVKFLRNSAAPVAGHEQVPVIDDLASFLHSPLEIDLAVITTPTHTHYDLAKACLEADKHVILEKPMTAAFSEAQELCRISRQRNKLLAVYQNRRWDGDFLTVAKLIKCGAVGNVVELESHFDRFRNTVKPGWKESELPGSGVLYDLGSHLIDQGLSLFGRPTSLTAHILNQRRLPASQVPDAFTLTLHYELPSQPQPLSLILRASMLTKTPGPRFTVHGTQGSYVKHGMDVQEGQLRAGMSPNDPGFGVEGCEGFGVLDSLALDTPMPVPTAAAHDVEGKGAAAEAVADAEAAALAARQKLSGGASVPAADVAAVAAGVLAKVDSGGVPARGAAAAAPASASSSSQQPGAVVKVMTERGCWMEFYNGIANILLGTEQPDVLGICGPAGVGSAAAAAKEPAVCVAAELLHQHSFSSASGSSAAGSSALRANIGSGATGSSNNSNAAADSSSDDLNSRLCVQPEQAAEVIRLIEAAMESSREGCTVKL